jgi:hypothetical protein
MDEVEAWLLVAGAAVIVLAIVIVVFRPSLGGDYRRGRDEAEYGTSIPGADGGGGDGGDGGGD